MYSIPYDVQEGRTLLAAAEKYWQALQGVVYCVEERETEEELYEQLSAKWNIFVDEDRKYAGGCGV